MKDRDELEEELELYKERLEEAMDAGNLAWWEMELPSGEVRFNDRKAEMLGYDPEEFEDYTDFTDLVHPEDHDRAMEAMRDHLEGREERYEVEYRIQRKDGDYKWFRDIGSITEEEGEKKKVAGIVIDIDERKEAEEREDLLNSLLRHDVKNKSQVVKGYLQLTLEKKDLQEDLDGYIEKALGGNEEIIDLIKKVRLLLSAQKEETEEVDIGEAIQEAAASSRSLAEDNGMDISVVDGCEPCKVEAGPLLREALSNIIENSVYHSQGNKVKVTTDVKKNDVVCVIEDDGKGIPDDEKGRIFNRGYTTDKGRGTGLGMFIVKMLVETYGGSIEVKDSDLGGARFDVRLQKA